MVVTVLSCPQSASVENSMIPPFSYSNGQSNSTILRVKLCLFIFRCVVSLLSMSYDCTQHPFSPRGTVSTLEYRRCPIPEVGPAWHNEFGADGYLYERE